jgi:UDPglucose 6-dehydrogenase
VWGLAFKPETDDMREASSIDLIRALCQAGAQVVAHDPVANEVAEHVFADLLRGGRLTLANDAVEATKEADALVVVTEWKEYRDADFAAVKRQLKGALVLDGRNHLDLIALKQLGFQYSGIGRV